LIPVEVGQEWSETNFITFMISASGNLPLLLLWNHFAVTTTYQTLVLWDNRKTPFQCH